MNITLRGDVPALIGPTLRRIRKARKMTLKDVSDAAGCSLVHISEVERGATCASIKMLIRWLEALGFSLAFEFEEQDRTEE